MKIDSILKIVKGFRIQIKILDNKWEPQVIQLINLDRMYKVIEE